MDDADMDRLPSSAIAQPDAVLYGHQKGNESLLDVFTPALADGRVAKVVVRTDYKQDVRRAGRDGEPEEDETQPSMRFDHPFRGRSIHGECALPHLPPPAPPL